MGYAAAADQVSDGRHHRVVLLSDGVANIGQTDQDRINADIQKYRNRGIYLNTIGVGMENHNDAFLEQLTNDHGNDWRRTIDTASRPYQFIKFDPVIQRLQRFVQIQRFVLSTGNAVLVDVDGIVDVPIMLQQSLPGGRIGPKVLLLMLGEHVQSSSFLDVIVTRMQSGQERERGRRIELG